MLGLAFGSVTAWANPVEPHSAAPSAAQCMIGGPCEVRARRYAEAGIEASGLCDAACDRKALVALYESAGGEHWHNNDNWLSDRPVGEWHNVWVSPRTGRVVHIDLSGNGLSGSIPAEVGLLTELDGLRLGGNRLSGEIPRELGHLTNLNSLTLYDNALVGRVPQDLTQLRLDMFWWFGNGFCIPDTVSMVEWIGGIANHLGPDLCNMADRTIFGALYKSAGGSRWTNTDGWPDGSLGSRHGIEIDSNGRVLGIDLSSNELVGELPSELSDLSLLDTLRLTGNPDLGGRLPYTMARLKALTELEYDQTDLCVPKEAFIRNWLNGLSKHVGTEVDCAPSEAREILKKIYDSMGGTRWFNSGNWFTDAPLRDWWGVSTDVQGRVTGLNLTHSNLKGSISPDIAALQRLTFLALSAWDSKGSAIPPELGELSELETLNLSGMHGAGPIPPELGKLSKLQELNLAGNEFSGPIPMELGNLSALTMLILDDNQFTAIPSELGNAASLSEIHIANNALTGALPTGLARLSKLTLLDLSGNRLSGTLPSVGEFSRLRYLNLSYSQLTGPLPVKFADLSELLHLQAAGPSSAHHQTVLCRLG